MTWTRWTLLSSMLVWTVGCGRPDTKPDNTSGAPKADKKTAGSGRPGSPLGNDDGKDRSRETLENSGKNSVKEVSKDRVKDGKNSDGSKTPPKKEGGPESPPKDTTPVIKKSRADLFQSRNVRDFAISRSGSLLSWATDDKIHLWDLQTNKRKAEQPVDKFFDVVRFSPDGATVALGSDSGPIGLWDVETFQIRILKGHSEVVRALAFLPDKRLASGGFDRTLRIWQLGTDLDAKSIPLPDRVGEMKFSADGQLAVVRLFTSGQFKVWDLQTGMELPKKLPAPNREAAMAFSADGKTLALGSDTGDIFLWDVENGAPRKTLKGDKKIYMLSYSADGTTLASAELERASVWDTATGELRAVIPAIATRVALSADGQVVASGDSMSIRVWDVPRAKAR